MKQSMIAVDLLEIAWEHESFVIEVANASFNR